jgi:hypothetical protein
MAKSVSKSVAKKRVLKNHLKYIPTLYTIAVRRITLPDAHFLSTSKSSAGPWVLRTPIMTGTELKQLQHYIDRWSLVDEELEYSIVKLTPSLL